MENYPILSAPKLINMFDTDGYVFGVYLDSENAVNHYRNELNNAIREMEKVKTGEIYMGDSRQVALLTLANNVNNRKYRLEAEEELLEGLKDDIMKIMSAHPSGAIELMVDPSAVWGRLPLKYRFSLNAKSVIEYEVIKI